MSSVSGKGKKPKKKVIVLSKLELTSWYLYDFANSPWYQAGLGMFFPVILLALASSKACPWVYPPKSVAQPMLNLNLTNSSWNMAINSTFPRHCTEKSYDVQRPQYSCKTTADCNAQTSANYICPEYNATNFDYRPQYEMNNAEGTQWSKWTPFYVPESYGNSLTFYANSSDETIIKAHKYTNPDAYQSGTNTDKTYGTEIDPVKKQFRVKAEDWMVTKWQSTGVFITIVAVNSTGHAVAHQTVEIQVKATEQCFNKVPFWGSMLNPAAFQSRVTTLSVLIQAVVFCSVSSFGDFGALRKILLVFCAVVGSAITILMYWSTNLGGDDYASFGNYYIFSNVLLGLSICMYNAYLPFMLKDHPQVRELMSQKAKAGDIVGKYKSIMDVTSAWGFFWGFVAGIFVMILGVLLLAMSQAAAPPGEATQYAMNAIGLTSLIIGFWWLLFTVPLIFFLNTRPGPPVPGGGCGGLGYIFFSWERVLSSGRTAYLLPHTWKYMIAYFLFSDAYNTVANVGVVFAQLEFNFGFVNIAIMALTVPIGCCLGIWLFIAIQRRYKIHSLDMIRAQLGIYLVMCLYSSLGFIPGTPVGLVNAWELYLVGFVHGMILGSIQSYARTCFADIVPPGQESEFFGLYEISDRGSSWIGPFVTSMLYNEINSVRPAFAYIMFMLIVAQLILRTIDIGQARRDCASLKMAMRMKAIKATRAGRANRGVGSFLSLNSLTSSMKSGVSSLVSGGSSVSSSASSIIASSSASEIESVASSINDDDDLSDFDNCRVESIIDDEDDDSDDEDHVGLKKALAVQASAAAVGGEVEMTENP